MKRPYVLPMLLVASALLLALCVLAGSTGFGLPDLETEQGLNIFELRLARVLTGWVVGAALACAGVLLQALLRNPLAEPFVLGVSSGAGLGAAAAIVAGLSLGGAGLPLAAFIAASLTLAVVYALANAGGKLSIYSLIISGVIVSSMCSSVLMCIVSLSSAEELHSILWWMLGNLDMPSTSLLVVGSAAVAAGVLAAWALAPELNALTLGTDMAHYLGIRTRLAVTAGLALATLVTATAVSMSGLIGFVGLIVPHAIRHLVGPDHKRLVPCSALCGGVFLAVCDALARTVLAPRELPVGVITAMVGGPFFIMILRRRKRDNWVE